MFTPITPTLHNTRIDTNPQHLPSDTEDINVDSYQDYTSLDPQYNMADILPCSHSPDC